MTIRGQHGKHHLYFHPVAVCTVLAIIVSAGKKDCHFYRFKMLPVSA